MKKIFGLVMATIMITAMASCGGRTAGAASDVDSTAVDSVAVDSVATDSVAVDSVCVD